MLMEVDSVTLGQESLTIIKDLRLGKRFVWDSSLIDVKIEKATGGGKQFRVDDEDGNVSLIQILFAYGKFDRFDVDISKFNDLMQLDDGVNIPIPSVRQRLRIGVRVVNPDFDGEQDGEDEHEDGGET